MFHLKTTLILVGLIFAPPAHGHPGHENYQIGGHCSPINQEVKVPCSVVSLGSDFIIEDGIGVWKYTETLDMIFASLYSVELNGEELRNDICWKSDVGIHCKGFSFTYE
jgi:hypothetical protein